MKRLLVLAIMALCLGSISTAHPPHQGSGISFGVFYSSLGSYGEWIYIDNGLYAWRPFPVSSGWRPYAVGRWVWTSDGWYWVSDEPWGWAAYHYGRWYYDDFYGWMWIPGYEWAPAWVEWRYGDDCAGWAPLGPYAAFSVDFGIHYTTHWVTPGFWWSFVDCRYIGSPKLHHHIYGNTDNTRWIGRTRSAGSVQYRGGRIVTRGPERDYVESRGKVRIGQVEIVDASDKRERFTRSGGRDRIEVFRPTGRDPGLNDVDHPKNFRKAERRVALNTDAMGIRVERRPQENINAPDQSHEKDRLEKRREDDSRGRIKGEDNHRSYRLPPDVGPREFGEKNEVPRVEKPAHRGQKRFAQPERTLRRADPFQPRNDVKKSEDRKRK